MFSKVRQFLKNNSPDWLNTEVNKDLLQNLSAPLSKGGWGDLDQSPEQVKPSLNKSLPGERSLTKSDNNDRPLMRSDCLLNTAKGKPHWRRINQVFQTLDTAPENATYNQLIEYVKETTGVGCSRKLISKWKKQNTSHKFPDHNPDGHEETTTAILVEPTIDNTLSTVNSFQFTETSNNSTNNNSLSTDVRANGCSPLITVKTWSYLAAVGIMVGLVGCEIIPLNNNQLTENIAFASVTTPLPPLPTTPETRKNRLEPSNIKIELTLSNPQDLKVKPGDKVSAGQTLSNRASERNRLQAKKKQLQLSIEKLNLPLTPIPQPRPIPDLNSLPPVSYAEEEAAIKLHKQKLTEAEQAIALQQKKIDSLTQLDSSSEVPPLSRGVRGDREQDSTPNLKLILEHEQANLKNLEAARQSAQIQLEVQESQLTTAKEQRAYIEYQRQLELTRRAIAISQQHQAIQQTESERQVLLAEREYSIAQIETQIQEIDYQIEQLSTVKAPYEGTIKKVKWTGQSDHTLTALITLAVNDHRATIANDTGKPTSNTEIRETTEEDK
jgi:biotin carboxyl carrier protein